VKREKLAEELGLWGEELDRVMWLDGFDDCVAGVLERFGMGDVLVYDRAKVIGKLVKEGMTREGAEEWYGFNMLGAWVGAGTPGFLRRRAR
jgi:hypothetical protein